MTRSGEPAVPEKRKTRRRILLLFVFSQVVAFCAIIEIGARLFDPMGISYYPETARLLDQMIMEEPIGYRMPPGHVGRYHGVDVRINALGMRDRPVPAQKEAGEFRILMIGDSVVFSIGVELEDSVPFQVERLANAAAPPGRHYRTLNMGVPSYNTEQEQVQTDELGLTLQPDAAVLLFVANDAEDKMWVYEKRSTFVANFAQRSYGASLAYAVLQPWAMRLARIVRPKSDTMELEERVGASQRNPRFDTVARSLTKISRGLRSIGTPLLLIHRRQVEDGLVDVIRDVGQREGFPVRRMDVWADPRWKDEDPTEYKNSSVDQHCNPRGCELVSTVIYELMMDTGLLERELR